MPYSVRQAQQFSFSLATVQRYNTYWTLAKKEKRLESQSVIVALRYNTTKGASVDFLTKVTEKKFKNNNLVR